MKIRLFNSRFIAIGMTILLSSAAAFGTVTFADLAGTANNTSLSSSYGTGLPVGVSAQWNGWLLHQNSDVTPMSIFPEGDLVGNDAEIIFSEPVIISSIRILDTGHGSPFALIGYFEGTEVWRFDSSTEGVWQTVTSGANIEIDTFVAEGKWNHLDDFVVYAAGDVLQPGEVEISMSMPGSSTNEIELSWPGVYGLRDQLQSATALSSNTVWQNEGSAMLGYNLTNIVTMGMDSGPTKFFRLKTEIIPSDELTADYAIATNDLPTPPSGYVWAPIPEYSDEFNGSALNTSKWQPRHPYWSGREPSRHLPENVSVAGGKLRLKNSVIQDPSTVADPTKDVWVGAACITSLSPTASYGYYETKMKASAICMTSAFWFQEGPPQPNGDSEIDVVEQLGVSYNNPHKEYWMQMNTHYYPNGWPTDQSTHTHWTMPTRAREEYHVYGVWWKDANTLWMYHNGVKVSEMTPAGPFIDSQYMFFDTEVFHWEGLPTVTNLNNDNLNTMYVDWVRGWQLVPE